MSGILVVDDEEGVLAVLNRILELLMPGYDISTATNGLMAWQQLQQRSFDLLLTDFCNRHMGHLTQDKE